MKYDDASWHYAGDFPKDLPYDAGATRTGMFVARALLTRLGGSIHRDDFPDDIHSLRLRTTTPGQFFLNSCDGKFTDEDLNEEGHRFARAYFYFQKGSFLAVYERVLAVRFARLYHVPDTWETFDKLRSVLDRRLIEWRSDTSQVAGAQP